MKMLSTRTLPWVDVHESFTNARAVWEDCQGLIKHFCVDVHTDTLWIPHTSQSSFSRAPLCDAFASAFPSGCTRSVTIDTLVSVSTASTNFRTSGWRTVRNFLSAFFANGSRFFLLGWLEVSNTNTETGLLSSYIRNVTTCINTLRRRIWYNSYPLRSVVQWPYTPPIIKRDLLSERKW